MKQFEENMKKAFKPGTSLGKFSFGLLFFAIGLLIVLIGFWKAMFVLLITLVGVFIGSADTIGKATAKLIDKIIPPRNQKVVYTQEDLEKVKEAARKREAMQQSGLSSVVKEEQQEEDKK